MARVLLEKVSKRFGEVVSVKEFDLEIRDKEFLVLVGPSGCGKSTTLRMVAGLEELTSGNIYIGDRLVNHLPPKDRDIAMVFQNYALYPHMNAYENMAFGLKLRKTPRAEIDRRVREAAEILGIGELLKRRPKELSGGQRQRVALGRAIVREPQVFLMDEPLSNLDAKLRVQMRTELSKLHRRLQATVIYVTHDQTEAMTMGDRIVVMKDGIVQQVDTPQEIYARPANKFVAGFIGSPPMNFLNVAVVEGGDLQHGADGTAAEVGACGGESPLCLDGGTFRLPVPRERMTALRHYLNHQVVLGIRPEDIHLPGGPVTTAVTGAEGTVFSADRGNASSGAARNEATSGAVIRAEVEVVEPLGAETYIYVKSGTHSFTARVAAGAPVRDGDVISVVVDTGKMHLFNSETEKTIRSCPRGLEKSEIRL